ncbi:MAG TPA: hypothetical protein VMZ50_08930 [Phycisphaerae bacterium]|nr:hypothetical protein [Phycisphaerae bacterium]
MIDYVDRREVLAAIADPSMPERLLGRPMRFGDAAWIEALRIMNGEHPYCPLCLTVFDWLDRSYVGVRCGHCHDGFLVPGAAMEAEWRAGVGLGEEMRA